MAENQDPDVEPARSQRLAAGGPDQAAPRVRSYPVAVGGSVHRRVAGGLVGRSRTPASYMVVASTILPPPMTCSPGKDRAPSPIRGWPSRPASAGPRSTGTGRPRRTCSAMCSSQPSCHPSPTPPCPCGSWLHAELRQLADELALPAVASLAIALMEQTRSGGAGASPHRHITAITERLAAAFALAVDAGELDKAPDADLAAAHLIGPSGLPDHPASHGGTRQPASRGHRRRLALAGTEPDAIPPNSAPGQPAGSNKETNAVAQA